MQNTIAMKSWYRRTKRVGMKGFIFRNKANKDASSSKNMTHFKWHIANFTAWMSHFCSLIEID